MKKILLLLLFGVCGIAHNLYASSYYNQWMKLLDSNNDPFIAIVIDGENKNCGLNMTFSWKTGWRICVVENGKEIVLQDPILTFGNDYTVKPDGFSGSKMEVSKMVPTWEIINILDRGKCKIRVTCKYNGKPKTIDFWYLGDSGALKKAMESLD